MHFQFISTAEASVVTLMNSIDRVIINPLIMLVFACALVFFLFGVAKYVLNPESEEVRKTSKSHMLWGVLGMFIMVSVFFIMNLITRTLGESKIQINNKGEITVQKVDLNQK